MNRTLLLAVATILFIGLTAAAEQSSGSAAQEQPAQRTSVPNAEEHLRILSESLNLSAAQQQKLRPIIQNMLDQRQRLMHDQRPVGRSARGKTTGTSRKG
jgi:Spy/CpxP family protein refolding chaperone